MRKNGILNTELPAAVSAMGHTDYCVIADAGLPIPEGVRLIDLALVSGIPSFEEVLSAVCSELVCEAFALAEETKTHNPAVMKRIDTNLSGLCSTEIPHEELKFRCKGAKFIVRTGECSPYSNIILYAGVFF